MIETVRRSALEPLMKAHGIRVSKSLGQNFLIDANIAGKIADAANLSRGDTVVEIGSGLGALTRFLSARAGHVTGVELDRRLIPALKEAMDGLTNVEIINEDYLKFDDSGLENGYILVGNLPYYAMSAILAKAISARSGSMIFMMQKEVAERITSMPGVKAYGALSVFVQYHMEAEVLFNVGRGCFLPQPGVDSVVTRLARRHNNSDDPETAELMFRLVRAGFDQRRKTLRNSLLAIGYPEEKLAAALSEIGSDLKRRAETLSPRDFYALAAALRRAVRNERQPA